MMNWTETDHEKLNRAIVFAVEHHAGQCRKGTTRPYILHPMEVAVILNSMDADPELLAAGLLHDTVEDTEATPEDLRREFGREISRLVGEHTEDKSRTWQERKSHAIAELRTAEDRVQMLVLADKLANVRSMARDYRREGEALWSRFNAPKDRQRWYYGSVLEALSGLRALPQCASAYEELERLCRELFGEQ